MSFSQIIHWDVERVAAEQICHNFYRCEISIKGSEWKRVREREQWLSHTLLCLKLHNALLRHTASELLFGVLDVEKSLRRWKVPRELFKDSQKPQMIALWEIVDFIKEFGWDAAAFVRETDRQAEREKEFWMQLLLLVNSKAKLTDFTLSD